MQIITFKNSGAELTGNMSPDPNRTYWNVIIVNGSTCLVDLNKSCTDMLINSSRKMINKYPSKKEKKYFVIFISKANLAIRQISTKPIKDKVIPLIR